MPKKTYGTAAANEVRAELARQHKSGSWLAHELGISIPAMQRRLSGKVAFDLDDLHTIANVLEVPLSRILHGLAS